MIDNLFSKQVVTIRTMGLFTIVVNGELHEEFMTKSSKGLSLIQYLILEQGNLVSTQRLIFELYPNQSSDNPKNALKTLVSRVRASLNELSPSLGACIVSTQGAYHWENREGISVDVLDIISLLNDLRGDKDTDDFSRKCEELLELYRGDLFLTGDIRSGETISNWLHKKYLEAIYRYIKDLKSRKEYRKICSICQRAITIDCYDEKLSMSLMDALVHLNRRKDALIESQDFERRLSRSLDSEPSKEYLAFCNAQKRSDSEVRSVPPN